MLTKINHLDESFNGLVLPVLPPAMYGQPTLLYALIAPLAYLALLASRRAEYRMPKVLIVDDDRELAEALHDAFADVGS